MTDTFHCRIHRTGDTWNVRAEDNGNFCVFRNGLKSYFSAVWAASDITANYLQRLKLKEQYHKSLAQSE